MKKNTGKSLTVIELMTSVLVFSILFAAFMTLIDTTIRVTKASSKLIAEKIDLDTATNAITREIRLAVVESISKPTVNDFQKVMDYRVQTGFVGGIDGVPPRMILSAPRRMRLIGSDGEIMDNGVDDNGNGLIDEGTLTIENLSNGKQIRLIGNIIDMQFSRDHRPSITVTLKRAIVDSTQRDSNGKPLIKFEQVVRSVYLANNQPIVNVILEENLGNGNNGNGPANTSTMTTASGLEVNVNINAALNNGVNVGAGLGVTNNGESVIGTGADASASNNGVSASQNNGNPTTNPDTLGLGLGLGN